MFFAATSGAIHPVATSYNAHAINHVVATPIASAPFVASAPAPYIARASYVASPTPYASAYSYPYNYPYLF